MSTLSPFREDVAVERENWLSGLPPLPAAAGGVDFGAAEGELQDPDSHPVAAAFPLPAGVLEALGHGLTSVAIGLAAAAGYRDVDELTNVVFYFRHPEMVGRRIRPDERVLAREWLTIRDRIVQPALRPSSAAHPAAPAATSAAPASGTALSPALLQWPEANAEQLAFMRAVYEAHARNAKASGRRFVADLPKSELGTVDGFEARKDAAEACARLLAEARAQLAADGLADKARIGIVSAYRPATLQFQIWQGRMFDGKKRHGGFPYYYDEAVKAGIVRAGDYGSNAVEAFAKYLGKYIASPGYSNHQDGLAFDFGTGAVGNDLAAIGWRSWFRHWLEQNGRRLHFVPLPSEAWHWTYAPSPSTRELEAEGEPVPAASVRAGRREVAHVPLLARHRGIAPDLVLRWNDMPRAPSELDVVVHLHGYWYPRLSLTRDIEPVSGLDLSPLEGESGAGRGRPTLTVLPRGHDTGVKQPHGPYNAYTFPALVTRTGLPALVDYALGEFAAATGGAVPGVSRLILTAHSGGGLPLVQILEHHDPHQVHVFDALYWSPDALVAWVRRRIRKDRAAGGSREYMESQGGALRVFYQGHVRGGTRPNSLALRRAVERELGDGLDRWYRVEASDYDHFQIPRRHGWRVLADASADVPHAQVEARASHETEAPFDEPAARQRSEGATPMDALSPFREDTSGAAMELGELERPAWEELDEAEGVPVEGSGGRMPWDIPAESHESMTPDTPTGEAYGAEPEAEGLTFYGLPELEALEEEREDAGAGTLRALLAKGYWSAAVAFAIITGERDRNKLTNMVFWARHPELDGKKIPAGNKKLADEWKAIYTTMVLPPLGPVSPSTVDPTAVPSAAKSIDTLIVDIFNSEQQVLTAWSGALTQFQVVMNANSDAEGVPDFVGAVMKHVGDEVIGKIAGEVPGLSYAKGLLDTVTAEYERARAARDSAQLRDFLVRFTGILTDAMNNLGRAFGDYKQMVEDAYAKAGPDDKKRYQKALAEHLDSLDRNWTNVNNVFQLICQEWIRNTMYRTSAGWVTPGTPNAPAFVRISVNQDYSVRRVELMCHGGQKIAEQLLKNAAGQGLRPYAWPVPRRILYFTDSGSWPSTFVNLASDGRWVQQGASGDSSGERAVLDHLRNYGLGATTKVEGG